MPQKSNFEDETYTVLIFCGELRFKEDAIDEHDALDTALDYMKKGLYIANCYPVSKILKITEVHFYPKNTIGMP